MSEIVIRAEGLGKRYRVGERERYLALRDLITRTLAAPFRRDKKRDTDFLWALRDMSFDIRQGEVVGLIGRNGAGKSTLLKVLSRITRPTAGYAEIQGRVGSLLEVGTGFHPELTGRENVYLSGAILGMKHAEISRRFDEIVAFAEVERFLDAPLKHYSSGMQMRLAFAVAAHLEPEILLVDEVLAVGDFEFQKKCLGKMQDVSKGGRTVVFVSHQMNQIRRLCQRALWVDSGQLRLDGPAEAVIGAYEQSALSTSRAELKQPSTDGSVWFVGWEVVGRRGGESNVVSDGSAPVSICIRVQNQQSIRRGKATAFIYDGRGLLISGWSFDPFQLSQGEHDVLLTFSDLPLRPGAYSVIFSIYDDDGGFHSWSAAPALMIESTPVTHFMDEWAGVLNIPCSLECRLSSVCTSANSGALR